MKKIFLSFVFILAGIITIFAQSVYQDPNRTPIGSNKTVLGFFTSSPPIIDGILDDDCWTMAPGAVGATSGGAGYNAGSTSFPSQPVQMRINLMDNGVNAPSFPPSNTFPTASYPTSAGSFGTSWDKDYLYFAIYVIDVEIANATIITGDYYGISLYLNNGNGTSGATTKLANDYPSLLEISGRDVQLALGYVPVGTAAEYPLIGDPGISVPQGIGIQNYPGSYKIAVKKMFNGYIYEGKISWKVLNKEFYKESDGSWDVSKGNESQWAPDAAGFTGSGRPPLRIDVGIDLYGTQKANPRGQMMWNQCCYNINWSRTQFYGYMSLQGAIVDVVCPSSITVSVSSVNISTPNGTATAKATVNAGATKEIAWGVLGTTSGGFPLAIIDKNTGVVTALNNGTVTVMAKSDNKTCASIASTSGVNGTASITISNQVAPTGFNIAGAGIASNWGTSTLSTTAIPANAPNYVTWSIEPASNLATINSITGVLEATALGSGTVTVKATSIANGVFSTRVINISTPAVISCFGINAYTKINQCNRPSKFIATVGGLSIGDQINLLAQYYDPALAFAGEIPANLMNFSILTQLGAGNFTLTKTARDWILTFGQITGRLTVVGTYFNKANSVTQTTNLILICRGSATFAGCSGNEFSIANVCNSANKFNQTISFSSIPNKFTTDAAFVLNASATSSLPISYTVVSGPAVVNGNTVTLNGTTGTVTIRASQAGDVAYNAAPNVDQSFAVISSSLLNQTVSIAPIGNKLPTDLPFTVAGVATSGLPVAFSILSGPASIIGNTITLNGNSGTVVVRADQNGNSSYNPASPVSISFTVCSIAKPIISASAQTIANCVAYKTLSATGNNLIWNTGNTGSSITATATGIYSVSATSSGCTIASDPFATTISGTPVQNICAVSIDDQGTYNQVVFNKIADLSNVANFKIYRETTITNEYEFLGTVAKNELSVFVDKISLPATKSYKYKIQVTDNCGFKAFGDMHKSIYLTLNKGTNNATWNLVWNGYEGLQVASYRIWRGTSVTNMQFVTSVAASAGSTLTYTDNQAPDVANLYYMVEILLADACTPTARMEAYGSIKSNLAQTSTTNIDVKTENHDLKIFPNPSNGVFDIVSTVETPYAILNLLGITIQSGKLAVGTTNLSLALPKGIYLLKAGGVYKKIVIE